MSMVPPRAPPETLTLAQLCRQSGATPRALRFYEELGLLSPRRDRVARVYSHREWARLQLILRGRRFGFSLKQLRELFETYDKAGRNAQLSRALPLFKERLAELELEREKINDALARLKSAEDRLAIRLEEAE